MCTTVLAAPPEYRLLQLNGNLVKWGEPVLGKSAVVTWALLDRPAHFDDALNCTSMVPLTLLAQNSGIQDAALFREIERAFAAWSNVADVNFRRIEDATNADIVLGAQSHPTGRAYSSVVYRSSNGSEQNSGGMALNRQAEILLDPVRSSPLEAPVKSIRQSLICLNSDVHWKIGFDGNLDSYDLKFTFMHEIGHTIGIDHPGPSGQVMGFRYDESVGDLLQPGDIAAVRRLYGSR
jgi:hypothetical protein